jgi:hypothetical protein
MPADAGMISALVSGICVHAGEAQLLLSSRGADHPELIWPENIVSLQQIALS